MIMSYLLHDIIINPKFLTVLDYPMRKSAFIEDIDLERLKNQRNDLVHTIRALESWKTTHPEWKDSHIIESLDGILNLVDYITDKAE